MNRQQSSSNQTRPQDPQIQQDNTEQQYEYNNQQMQQKLQGDINKIKVPKEPKNMKTNPLTNAKKAEIEDQKRTQLQSANKKKQQIPLKQQQPIQIQQQQQFLQQMPINKNYLQININNNYNDDDDILYQYQKQIGLQMNIEEMIELKVQAQYDYCKLKQSEKQTLPAMVSIITKDIEQYAKNNSSIEAVEVQYECELNYYMCGQKIQGVQQSLIQLLDFLSEKDRLCLIVFDGGAQRHTPLKTLTQDNKKYFMNAIAAIYAGGSTNIAAGTDIAFKQIQQRKMKNQVTSIFLLSDGQDSGAAQRIQKQMDQIDDVVTIHSFGYGSDHDAALMSSICKVGQGSFYYIENVKLLDEFFADALGRLSSALAEKIQIDIKCSQQIPYEDVKIQKTYGEMWKPIEQEIYYQINVPQIASDSRKDYVFEIALPSFTQQILDEQRVSQVIQVNLQFSNTFSKQIYQKVSVLQLKFYNEFEQIDENNHNEDVTREFLRVSATEAIDQARMKCELSKNEEAEDMLEKMKQNILTDQKLAKVSAQAILDTIRLIYKYFQFFNYVFKLINEIQIEYKKNIIINICIDQAKNASKRKNYANFGMKQMYQMAVNNYQQEGLNAQFDTQGKQMQQLNQGKFQNKKQLKMVQEVQKNKF